MEICAPEPMDIDLPHQEGLEVAQPGADPLAAPDAVVVEAVAAPEEAVQEGGVKKKGSKRVKPSWTYVDYGEPVVPEKLLFGSSLSVQLDDRYRNGPKGASFNLTLGNVVEGKRERKAKENFVIASPPKVKKQRSKSQDKVVKKPKYKKMKERSPSPEHKFLQQGTASRGPLNAPRKTLNELYPWKALSDDWMEKASGRLVRDEHPTPEWSADQKKISQYSQGYPLFMGAQEQEQLRKMWQVCSSIPGEGSNQEPLYGEINLAGTARLFAIWKELCGFGKDSVFLDVGSGLAKMVFHAAIDPGVKRACGIEMSEYRARTAQSILDSLLPKAGIGHIRDRVELLHEDVKAAVSWEGITHVYMFDLGFPANPFKGPYPHILKLWEESTTAEHMISYRKPTFLWLRGFRLQLVTKLSVKQQGNAAGSHCAYFYKKIRDGEQQVPVAVAEAHVADAAPAVPASVVDALPEDVAVAVGVAASPPVAAAAATPDVVAVAEQPIVPEMISEVQPENPQVVDFLPLV